MNRIDPSAEWLEADGLGGFASGTVSGIRTRRYHALLLTAATPPSGRVVLVNGIEAWVNSSRGRFAISSQRYAPDVIHPDGGSRIISFEYEPWPRWRFHLADDLMVEQELFVRPGEAAIYLSWKIEGHAQAKLEVRPFFSGRDFHALQHEDNSFRFEAQENGERVVWQPYADKPAVIAQSNGRYCPEKPTWYRNFFYTEEEARGLAATEDLAVPGVFEFELSEKPAVLMLAAVGRDVDVDGLTRDDSLGRQGFPISIETLYAAIRATELKRRNDFPTPVHRAADAYVVRRGEGKTIIAGYPWFGDWGRDTFIAMRGLCLATGRLEEARDILVEWAGFLSEGMLPNRFPDRGDEPEFNSVDASLWYVIAVGDYLRFAEKKRGLTSDQQAKELRAAVDEILVRYHDGTRFGIRAHDDGLLREGEEGYALTWMDARVAGRAVTPRIGKPVEIEALWINALKIGAKFNQRWQELFDKTWPAFEMRFWNEEGGYLYDVVDCDHKEGAVDDSFRPNQIFAVGGLPLMLLSEERARKVVDAVEERLFTPVGLRTLAPNESNYVGHIRGDMAQRDRSYHQGTVWPWLIGAFVEAWVRVRGSSNEAREEAGQRFLMPLVDHLHHAGLGHISEIADGDPPHTPAGCPFQAWSLGELLRLDSIL
ncbi:MAG: amylo-alpha-1,6-glucosidase [Chthoniobacterales bacterium]